jgi:hypothetical protein
MTPQDYMNPVRFPLTSQEDLSLTDQLQIDAFNLDQGREAMKNGWQVPEADLPLLAELEEKGRHAADVIRQAQEQGLLEDD